MATNVSLDPNNPDDKCSRIEVLAWINETLHTNFTQVEQCRSGTVFVFLFFLLMSLFMLSELHESFFSFFSFFRCVFLPAYRLALPRVC